MTEVDWGTEDNQAKPKKRVPTWVWIGGGCCGVAVIAIVALVLGGLWIGRKTMDQDANWAKLAQILPYDESYKSEDTKIMNIPLQPGVDDVLQIFGSARPTTQLYVRAYSGKRAGNVRKRMFEDLDTDAFRELGALKVVDPQALKITVQGRELDSVGFMTHEPSEEEEQGDKPREIGVMDAFKLAVRIVDVTPPGHEGLVLLQINELGANQPVSDETVHEVLAPFLIGPER